MKQSVTFRDLVLDEWGIDTWELDSLVALARNNDEYHCQNREIWNRSPRDSEDAVSDFYRGNMKYSAEMLYKLPLDKEVSTKDFWADDYILDTVKMMAPNRYILNYGCGFGNEGFCLYNAGHHVLMVDIDAPHSRVVSRVVQMAGDRKLEFQFVRGDKNSMPRRYYHVIACNQVMEHLWDPIATLEWFHKRLFPNGYLLAGCFFDDGDGRFPWHLKHNNVFGNTEYWLDCVERTGFCREDVNVWRRV